MRALFWLLALFVFPLLAVVAGWSTGSQLLAWTVIVFLPLVATSAAGRVFRLPVNEVFVASMLSAGVAVLSVVGFLWYLFEVNDFS